MIGAVILLGVCGAGGVRGVAICLVNAVYVMAACGSSSVANLRRRRGCVVCGAGGWTMSRRGNIGAVTGGSADRGQVCGRLGGAPRGWRGGACGMPTWWLTRGRGGLRRCSACGVLSVGRISSCRYQIRGVGPCVIGVVVLKLRGLRLRSVQCAAGSRVMCCSMVRRWVAAGGHGPSLQRILVVVDRAVPRPGDRVLFDQRVYRSLRAGAPGLEYGTVLRQRPELGKDALEVSVDSSTDARTVIHGYVFLVVIE